MEIYPKDWRYRLIAGLINIIAIGICIGAVMLFGPMLGIHGFWSVILAAVVGVVLGNLLIRRLVPPPSAGAPEPPPRE